MPPNKKILFVKIVYIHQYFKTPEQGGAIRSYYIAKGLVDAGHEVEIITAHNYSRYVFKHVDGIKVHYLPVSYKNDYGFLRRTVAFYRFVSAAYMRATKINAVDLYYITSTPLTVAHIALKIKKLGFKYVFEVRDLWPEALVKLGLIKWGFIKNYLYKLEQDAYDNAEKIIALSPDMKLYISNKANGTPVEVVPNFSDCEFFEPDIKHPFIARKYNCESKFTVAYIGAVGKANHLGYLLAVANLAQKQKLNIQFLIMGEGNDLGAITQSVIKQGLNNTTILAPGDKEKVKEVLSITDAVYVSYLNVPVLGAGSPNKFFDALAAGKLCIVNTQGWLKTTVENAHCGFYTNPENPENFIKKIKPYTTDKQKLKSIQDNARILAEQQFSRTENVKKLIESLEKTC